MAVDEVLAQCQPVAAGDVVAEKVRGRRASFEPGGEDDAVHLVQLAVHHYPGRGYLVDLRGAASFTFGWLKASK